MSCPAIFLLQFYALEATSYLTECLFETGAGFYSSCSWFQPLVRALFGESVTQCAVSQEQVRWPKKHLQRSKRVFYISSAHNFRSTGDLDTSIEKPRKRNSNCRKLFQHLLHIAHLEPPEARHGKHDPEANSQLQMRMLEWAAWSCV